MSHENLVGGLRGHDYDKPFSAMSRYLDQIDGAPYTAHRPGFLTSVIAATMCEGHYSPTRYGSRTSL